MQRDHAADSLMTPSVESVPSGSREGIPGRSRLARARRMLRRVGFHEEYDGQLIARLIQVMNSDDLGNSDSEPDEEWWDDSAAINRMGWYAASFNVAAVLGGGPFRDE